MPDMPKTVSVAYKEVPGRPVIPVGGAYGGPTPEGFSVVAHVYNEFTAIPTSEVFDVGEAGEVDLSKGKESTRDSTLTRLVTATLVFSPEMAIRVGGWLIKHGMDASQHRQKNQPEVKAE